MQRLWVSLAALLAAAPLAYAADLPATKSVVVAEPDCYSSIEQWWNTSASKCPLAYGPLTLFGTVDGGYGYDTAGSRYGIFYDKGVNYGVKRNSLDQGSGLWSQNALSTTNVGIKLKQKVGDGWEIVGAVEAGFNPYSGFIVPNGPKSLVVNNLTKTAYQTADGDSSRAGQFDNSQGFIGISNKTYGTVIAGRVNTLSADVLSAYDPVRSNAFSMLGFSGSYAGMGTSETARVNTGVVYRVQIQNFRFAGLSQFGNGYEFGNGSMGQYQGQVGFDWGNFSIDAVGNYARDAVSLSSFAGSGLPTGYNPYSILKATLSDNSGALIGARYKWKPFEFYAGASFVRLANPSDNYKQGFDTIAAGIFVPAGFVNATNYNVNRILNTYWTGVKWDTPFKGLTFNTGLYYHTQANYNTNICVGNYNTNSKCPGQQFNYSFLFTYKLFARIDLYGGMMISNHAGGLANGYPTTQNINTTAGLRFRF